MSLFSSPWFKEPPPLPGRAKEGIADAGTGAMVFKQDTASDCSDRSTAAPPHGGAETPEQEELCDDEVAMRARQLWRELRGGTESAQRLPITPNPDGAAGGRLSGASPWPQRGGCRSSCGAIARPPAPVAAGAPAVLRSTPPPLLAHSMALEAAAQAEAQAQAQAQAQALVGSPWQGAGDCRRTAPIDVEAVAASALHAPPRAAPHMPPGGPLRNLPGDAEGPQGLPFGLHRSLMPERKAELRNDEVAMRAVQAWHELHGGAASHTMPPGVPPASFPPAPPPRRPAAAPPSPDLGGCPFLPALGMPKAPPMMSGPHAAPRLAGTAKAPPPPTGVLLGTRPDKEGRGMSTGVPLCQHTLDQSLNEGDEAFTARKNGGLGTPMYVHLPQSGCHSRLGETGDRMMRRETCTLGAQMSEVHIPVHGPFFDP